MNSKILIIAGMHRSGTSLITQWLNRCGLPVGKKLIPGNVGNIEGHFEDMDFLEMHRQFLAKRNCPDSGFVNKPIPPLSAVEKKQISDLLQIKDQENNGWGWKEPRTCLFLDTYRELTPGAFYLFIVRDFHSTVNSLLAREYNVHMKKIRSKKGLSRLKWILFKKKPIEKIYALQAEQFLRIWIHYYERILQVARNLPEEQYQFVNYTSLLKDDTDIYSRLRHEWSFPLRYVPFADIYKKEFLSEIKDVERYIKDKSLVVKAKRIEREFTCYLGSSAPVVKVLN